MEGDRRHWQKVSQKLPKTAKTFNKVAWNILYHYLSLFLNYTYCIFWKSRFIKRCSGSTGALGYYILNETKTIKSNPMKQNEVKFCEILNV